MHLKRSDALSYVSWLLDDAGAVTHWSDKIEIPDNAVLIGWQCGFEPLFVAVKSYLPDVTLDQSEAVEIAIEYLKEIHWFAVEGNDSNDNSAIEPDFIIGGKAA